MRDLNPALAAHLAGGVTTLCTCWRLRRKDNVSLCFTDHDRDIAFDGSIFLASNGLEGTSSESNLGLAIGGVEINGVLTSGSLIEEDLSGGLYDGAHIEIWRVNWADTAQRTLLDIGAVGEVRRTAESFAAEVRSLAHVFDQEKGRRYMTLCDADVGDTRCGIDLNDPSFNAIASIAGGDGRREFQFEMTGFEDGFFDGGRLHVMSGPFAGKSGVIESHHVQDGIVKIRLWARLPFVLPTGTQVKLFVGCNKTFTTCQLKFGNHARFRGFPHVPGNDALLSHVTGTGSKLDGGSLFQ